MCRKQFLGKHSRSNTQIKYSETNTCCRERKKKENLDLTDGWVRDNHRLFPQLADSWFEKDKETNPVNSCCFFLSVTHVNVWHKSNKTQTLKDIKWLFVSESCGALWHIIYWVEELGEREHNPFVPEYTLSQRLFTVVTVVFIYWRHSRNMTMKHAIQ